MYGELALLMQISHFRQTQIALKHTLLYPATLPLQKSRQLTAALIVHHIVSHQHQHLSTLEKWLIQRPRLQRLLIPLHLQLQHPPRRHLIRHIRMRHFQTQPLLKSL